MKLSTLCHRLSQRRRILLLTAAGLLLIPLAFLLPDTLWVLLASPVLLMAALYLLWQRFSLGQFGAAYQRPPRPADAQAQTVLLDADLLDDGLSVQAVSQPVEPAVALSLRMGSGALLLGTAMTLLSDEVSPAEQTAIHRAVTRLNIHPDRMKAHSPILDRQTMEEYTAITVQDGPNERAYYLAEPAVLARLSSAIWEYGPDAKGTRPITPADRSRIQDAAAYMGQSNGRVLAYATAIGDERPTFLGLCALGQHLRMDAVQELSRMKNMGLAVMLRDPEDPAIDTDYLRRTLDIPDVYGHPDLYLSVSRDFPDPATLTIRPLPDQPLTAPIVQLRTQFARAEGILAAFAASLATLLCCCILCGNVLSALGVTALMLLSALLLGLPVRPRLPRRKTIIAALAGSLLLRLFVGAVLPPAALGAGGMMCILLALPAALYSEETLPPWERLLPLCGAAAALALLCGILSGMTLLTALLSLLTAALITLLGWVFRR